jgi:CBS domain-containing protein
VKVAEVYRKFSKDTDTAYLDTPIENVIKVFMKSRERRTVYVIDKSGRLLGMIRPEEIFRSVRPDITPNRIIFFLKKESVKTAKDVMLQSEMVSPEDDLEDALRTAKIFKLQDMPVCRYGKLVGELNAFELVYGLMKSGK